MSYFNKAEKVMENWASRGIVTEAGKNFLVCALDPFHDTQLKTIEGWPDVETSPSVCRLIKQSITITKDPSLPSGNWDFMVVFWPWFKKQNFVFTTARNNNAITTAGAMQPLGGLQVFQVPSGQDFDMQNSAMVASQVIELADDVLQGSNRLIGAGYEIHNTTAEIQKQGAICNFLMHNVPKDASTFVKTANISGSAVVTNIFNGTSFRAPPRNTKEALLLPGSVEWKAAEGCYTVARFAGVDNPPYTVDYNMPVLYEVDDVPGPLGTNTSQICFPADALSTGTAQLPAWKSFPIHTSGSIVTGQSDTCSFRLNFNAIVESFPSPRDTKDLTIARPSASFDPNALAIYSHALSSCPVSVPVNENPLGEWFMDVVGQIGKFLSPMGGIPGAIGTVAGLVHDNMKNFNTTPSGKNTQGKVDKPLITVTKQEWSSKTASERKGMLAQYKVLYIS